MWLHVYFHNAGVSLNKARQQVLLLLGNNDTAQSGASQTQSVNTPTLDGLARDLTAIAREGR